MNADITGSQLSLLCKTLGLGMSSSRSTQNWLPDYEALDHLNDLAQLIDKGLMESGDSLPPFYKATPDGRSLAMRSQNYDKEVARGR